MRSDTHFIIFSHGFGVQKDSRGLFSDIASALKDTARPVMFDYSEIDEVKNIFTATPFSRQAALFQEKLTEVRRHEGAVIDVICHSQGSIAVALAKPKHIRKILFLAPPIDLNIDRMRNTFGSRPGVKIHPEGISKLLRRDGSTTLVPPGYWSEWKDIHPIESYNRLAEETELIIVKANQDELLGGADYSALSQKIKVLFLDGDHNFKGEARQVLLDIVKAIFR